MCPAILLVNQSKTRENQTKNMFTANLFHKVTLVSWFNYVLSKRADPRLWSNQQKRTGLANPEFPALPAA